MNGNRKSIVSRSAYINRLRRAFILRCHPDRFRQHDDAIRKQQSVLLQALGERMVEEDFKEYSSNKPRKQHAFSVGNNTCRQTLRNFDQSIIRYVIEKRDGSLLWQELDLNNSVENILQNLATALESSGASKIPRPHNSEGDSMDKVEFIQQNFKNDFSTARYNVNSNRGRDLKRFLSSVTRAQIEERKATRMDVIAATLVARRLFCFQSIDGVRLGWSPKAFTTLMSSLVEFHEEYKGAFVRSFYPLRLVFSQDERKESLDIYEGSLYLNPSATHLEWLKCVKEVTEEKLEQFSMNRLCVTERVTLLQERLSNNVKINEAIKVQKGFTCCALEYFNFLERNGEPHGSSSSLPPNIQLTESNELIPLPSSAPSRFAHCIRIVVESPTVCRRARITKEGLIQVPSTISSSEINLAVRNLFSLARERHDAEQHENDKCREAVAKIQWKLGLQNITRSSERVCYKDFFNALSRLLNSRSLFNEECLSGASLRVASNGQYCHLADDGALVIPHDWI